MPIALADVTLADRCGGKAAALGVLIRAGLPVPDGFAIGGPGSAEEADVRARAAALGPRLAVRSSMSIEDARGGAGAGVFASFVDVPAAEVWDAISAVWASADTPIARLYAAQRGAAAIEPAVIVQRFAPGARVTVYTRPPGAPARDEVWIGDARVARDADAIDPRVVLALRAEAALVAAEAAAPSGSMTRGGASEGVDVELIVDGDAIVVVQARPIVHPAPRVRRAPPDALFAFTRATPGVAWRWDAAHNPSPLSPAQAGLVERVDASGVAPYRMRVVAGYLYATASDEPAATAPDAAALRAIVLPALAVARAWIDHAGASLADALAAYVAFYRGWAREVGPPLAATRRALAGVVSADDPAWHPRGTITARLAAGDLAMLGALAPAWDVAAPTASESSARLEVAAQVARARAPRAPEAPLDPPRALAAAVAELAEADDLAFARAQALVRRALLAEAARRGLDPADDVFWLPLDEIAEPAHELDPIVARARAQAARSAAARAGAWDMPLAVVDGVPAAPPARRGRGWGGRATGRAFVIDDLAALTEIPAGAIVVVPAVTPALALYAQAAAAIVADHGGALDHGVALARELGIPYLIAPGATRDLAPGTPVIVDGYAGTIETA